MSAALAFELPRHLEATEPPPERDRVRMLVASRAGIRHATFRDLPDLLEPGDLLVVNTSATLPAALPLEGGLRLHLSTPLPAPPGRSTSAPTDADTSAGWSSCATAWRRIAAAAPVSG